MKLYFILVLLILPLLLLAITRTVSLDGTQQYVSIQTAIDASTNGDIVEVYPGEYMEHLNTGGRSITIQSRYYITQSDSTISTTIIHSVPQFPCLKVNTQESVIINGFTIMNNFPVNLGVNMYASGVLGGGIYVTNNSSIQILNCVITNCIGSGTGGVYFGGINFYMSNTKIYNNYGIDYAGGVIIYGNDANSINFDNVNKNSIYNNTSRHGMDLTITNWDNPLQVCLDTFSVNLTTPDYFFFSANENSGINISVQYAYFTLINHDLYVSPTGNNSNDGLSPLTPLQTVAYAVKIIESDSLNPKTIHLAPGTYNFSDSNQYFPFTVKSHTRIIGDSIESTFFDSEDTRRYYFMFSYKEDIIIENISFAPYVSQIGPIGIGGCEDITLRNLKFDGIFGAPRLDMIHCNNIICENMVFSEANIENDNMAFRIVFCSNILLNNIVINNLDIIGLMANVIGFFILEADVVLRNSIIANCDGLDISVLFYQNVGSNQSDYNIELSNMLIYNNRSTDSNTWSASPVYLSNKYQRMKVNNCTVANNNGAYTKVFTVRGDCDINNSIFYNPENYGDVVFWNVYNGYSHQPSINYSLLNSPFYATDSSLVSSSNLIVNTNPMFLGIEYFDIVQPEYYQLRSNSPCINTGTPDTLGLNIPALDLAGNDRIWNGRIDMGCYEYASVLDDNPEYSTLPDKIMLSIYPNPVYLNSKKGAYTFIEFTLPNEAKEPPLVEIFNIKGQRVKSMRLTESYNSMVHKAGLSNQVKQSGEFYSTVWNGKDERNKSIGTGTYIIRVSADGSSVSKKLILLK